MMGDVDGSSTSPLALAAPDALAPMNDCQVMPRFDLALRSALKFRVWLVCVALFALPASAQTLEQLIASTLISHPTAQAQRALERSAKAGVDSALWQHFPTPSVVFEKASANAANIPDQGDEVVSTLRLQQPLWTGGRLTAGVQKAKAAVTVSQMSLEDVRQQLALRVIQTYGEWLGASLKTQAYEKSLAAHVRLHEQVQRRVDQGASSHSDLTLAVSRLKAINAEITLTQTQKQIALARLEQLSSRQFDDSALSATVAAPRAVNTDAQELRDLALEVNPILHKAQAQAQIQEAVIAERRADLLPEVYLRLERQHGNTFYSNTGSHSRLYVGFSSRFGAGLSSGSVVEGARLQHEAAVAEVQTQRRAVVEQVLADHAVAMSLGSRTEALKAALGAAQQVAESYDRQFLAGRKNWLDVMNAARELSQTEIQLADLASLEVVVTWRLAIYTQGLAQLVEANQ